MSQLYPNNDLSYEILKLFFCINKESIEVTNLFNQMCSNLFKTTENEPNDID